MKKSLLYIILLLFSVCLSAQKEYKGIILDATTNEPLPYVNIGIVDKGIGTVSNENGRFYLDIDPSKVGNEDVLQISFIGYQTIQKSVGSLNTVPGNSNKLLMKPDVLELNEVVLSAKNLQHKREKIVGFSYRSRTKLGHWKGDGSLGAELVTKIDVNKKKRRLNEFYFHVVENYSDSVLVRVNIYKGGTMYPDKKLLKKNLTKMIYQEPGKITINLKPYNLIIDDDFSIGLELLNFYGDKVGLVLAADDLPSTSYRRYVSQDKWKSFRGDAMTFYLNTTVLSEGSGYEENSSTDYVKSVPDFSAAKLRNISGIVFNNGEAVENATVKVVGGFEQVRTNNTGRYNILVNVGDEISFDYLGMEQIIKKVTNNTFALNANLKVKVEELDNVIVSQKRKLKRDQAELFEAYGDDIGIFKSNFGILEKRTATVAVEIVDGDDLSGAAVNLIDAIANQFSGVKVRSARENEYGIDRVIYMRGGGSILNPSPAVFEIDGTVYQTPPEFLDIKNIKRIAKMAGLAATTKYGSVARGGIFIINTKTGDFSRKQSGKKTDQALVKNNEYTNDALPRDQVEKNIPEYLKQLIGAKSFQEAEEIFNTNSKVYGNTFHFFVDAYDYFSKKWNGENFHKSILESYTLKFEKHPVALKALAYYLQRDGEYNEALVLYKKTLIERANYAQSYRDVANSYQEVKELPKAANMYSRYNQLLNDDFLQADVDGSHPIIRREFSKFVLQNGSAFLSPDDLKEVAQNVNVGSIRLVIEWNDDQADFDLQFVNPKNKFFTWSTDENTNTNSNQNASMLEYFIDKIQSDNWKVNMKYRGNKSGAPIFVKITTYYNYGLQGQQETVEVFRVALKNVNQELCAINRVSVSNYR